jgi:hypothetical protein
MRISVILIFLLFLFGCAAVRDAESLATQKARLDLQHVPLGKLNQQGAYARYGPASRVIRLPNGHIGWVYTANDKRFAERTYTLEFADDGLLYDIFYTSYSAQKVSARDVQGGSSEAQD